MERLCFLDGYINIATISSLSENIYLVPMGLEFAKRMNEGWVCSLYCTVCLNRVCCCIDSLRI
jgi:hypothetical protein